MNDGKPGFVSSRNSPERRSCSFFDHRNAVPVLFGINVQKLNSLNMVLEAKSHVRNCKNHFEAQRLRIFEYTT